MFQLQKMYCERRKEQKSQKIIMCFKNVNKTTEYDVANRNHVLTNKGMHLPCLPPVRRPEPAMRRENQETNEMHTTLMDVIPENILHLNRKCKW